MCTTCTLYAGCPVLIVGAAAPFLYRSYYSAWSCWVNFGSRLAAVIAIPIICILSLGIIVWESNGIYLRKYKPNEVVDRRQISVALISKQFYPILLFLTLVSWFLGAQAVFYQRLWLFTATFSLNISLGFAMLFGHISSDQEVCRNFFNKF